MRGADDVNPDPTQQRFDWSAAFDPPYLSDRAQRIEATFKVAPADFRVDELPLYEASGDGPHVYVTLQRSGQTTRELATELQRLFALEEVDIGYAGMKDKQALATQCFSLHLPNTVLRDVEERIRGEMSATLLSINRHGNKLRRGHLKGNRFAIRLGVSGDVDAQLERAEGILNQLRATELPNFYGVQRFGVDQRNAMRGESILRRGHRPRGFKERLFVNACQSALFNLWLAERIARDQYAVILVGDVAQKRATGGLFDVIENERGEAQRRLDEREICYTGPIFGAKMREARSEAGAREQELLTRCGIELGAFRRAKLDGTRRSARVALDEMQLTGLADALLLELTLPKGSYATQVVRELLKPEDPRALSAVDLDEDS